MEGDEDHRRSPSWSFATNWELSGGTLEGCITLETPVSSPNDEDANKDHQLIALTTPTSSDSGPCEIEVILAQRHEIRQVYVRSTARVYEIYLHEAHSKEYLCTVRCGVAGKEESVPNDTSDEKAICAQLDGNTMEPLENKVKNDNNGTNEDDWVEVKVPSPPSDGSYSILSRKVYGESQSIKDFYEATAEIRDSNPCIGFTLRLLSLQTKGCIHLEEIYIFAEPVESYATDHPMIAQEKSGESKLLAMLVPTLLQLSKSGVNKMQNRYISNDKGKGLMPGDDDVEETNSLGPNITRTRSMELQWDIPFGGGKNMKEANTESAKSMRSEYDGQDPGKLQGLEFVAKENDRSCSRAEGLLDKLFHRLGRIETFCEGIERNMMKSLSTIDTRLQRLEQQMELLTTRSQSPELFYSSIKITAPEFSCNDSETNSGYNDDQNYITSEFSKEDIYEKDEYIFGESKSSSIRNDVNKQYGHVSESCQKDVLFYESCYPQLLPQLVVTAPDFSVVDNYSDADSVNEVADASAVNNNECDGNDLLEMASKCCSMDKPSMSLDEALAYALAGFLSSSSAQTPQSGESSAVAVDCSPDESIKKCRLPSTGIQCDTASELCTLSGEGNTTENVKEIESMACKTIQVPSNCTPAAAAVNMVRAGPIWEEEFEDQCLTCSMDPSTDQCTHSNELDSLKRKDCEIDALNQSDVEAVGDNISFKISDQNVTQKESDANLTVELGSGTTTKTLLGCPRDFEKSYDGSSQDANDCGEGEAQSAECCDEFEKLPKPTFDGAVDFEFPILDVKFGREKSSNTESHLLALFGSRSDATTGDLFKEEVDVTTDSEPIKISPEESKITAIDEPFAELDDLSTQSNMESNQVESLSVCINQESSLI